MIHSNTSAHVVLSGWRSDFFDLSESKKKSGLALFKEKHGIKAVSSTRGSVGYSEKEKKWYGWSHRAMYGFKVGDTVKEGHIPKAFVGKTAKNDEDAKKFAIAFSREVS